jgi:glycosyl-4,4'-diaponeurosporenoate acyltransferase
VWAVGFYPALWTDVTMWVLWAVAVGWWAARWSDAAVAEDSWLTRLRPWERGGFAYARIGVRRWKGRLPDAATLFGGRPKRLTARDEVAWAQLAGETRRAERVHWAVLCALPAQALLRGGTLLAIMACIAVLLNVPCIAAQRHNRGRLLALCERRRQRNDRICGAQARSGDANRSTPSRRSTDRRSATWSTSGNSTPR